MSDGHPRHISVPSACERIGGDKPINRSTFYRGVKAGIYPAPFHISPKSCGLMWKNSTKRLRLARAASRSDLCQMVPVGSPPQANTRVRLKPGLSPSIVIIDRGAKRGGLQIPCKN